MPSVRSRPLPIAVIALAVFAFAALLAVTLRGLAGDEEVAHYLIARYAPEQPELFLSLVGRPLVTLFLTLPAQFDLVWARLAMALATALGAVAVVRGARHIPGISPLWAVAFYLLQPFLLAHAATAMTEPLTAALVAWGVVAAVERRWILFALAVGALPLARFEMLVFLPLAAALLIPARAWIALGMLAVPLLLWNGAGWVLTGDPLYLVHLTDPAPYPRRDALHYLQSLVWITGLGLFVPLVAGVMRTPLRRQAWSSPEGRLLLGSTLTLAVLFMVYTATAAWKPITLGNLRYFAFVAAPMAWLAAAGCVALFDGTRRWLIALFGISGLGAVFLWSQPLRSDYELIAERTWIPALVVVGWILLTRIPRAAVGWGAVFACLLTVSALVVDRSSTLHVRQLPEEQAVLTLAATLHPDFPADQPIHASHPLLAFALGRNPYAQTTVLSPPRDLARVAPAGTVWFWETHYSHRKGVRLDPGAAIDTLLATGWRVASGLVSADSAWAGAFLVRSGPGSEETLAQFTPVIPQQHWAPLAHFAELGAGSVRAALRGDPNNAARYAELLTLARQLKDEGHPALGLALFNALPRSLDAHGHFVRGSLYASAGQVDAAGQDAYAASQGAGNDVDLALGSTEMLLGAGRGADAAAVVDRYRDRLPAVWSAHHLAGEIYRGEGRWDDAAQEFATANQIQPDDPRTLLRMAECAGRLGHLDACEAQLRYTLATVPDYAPAYDALGALLNSLSRPDEAIQVWRDGWNRTQHPDLRARLEVAGVAP